MYRVSFNPISMKRIFYILVFLSLNFIAFTNFQTDTAAHSAVVFQKLKWTELLDSAKKYHKPILVECGASWCLPCKQMENYTFTDLKLADYLNKNFYVIKWDAEDFDHIELIGKYKVEKYPTLLFINTKGDEISRMVGFQSAEKLIAAADKIKNPKKKIVLEKTKADKPTSPKKVEKAKK